MCWFKYKDPDDADASYKYGVENIPGEFIDISIPHKSSVEMKNYDTNNMTKYQFDDRSDINSFSYNSYTYKYFFKDLYKMIFLEVKFAWTEQKYKKRIKRIMFIALLELTSAINAESLIDKFAEFNSILNKIQKSQLTDTKTRRNHIDELKNLYFYKDKKILIRHIIYKLIHYLGGTIGDDIPSNDMYYLKLAQNLDYTKNTANDYEKLSDNLIKDILDLSTIIHDNILEYINNFIKRKGVYPIKRITEVNQL